jgi:altronate dehydratase small subunit
MIKALIIDPLDNVACLTNEGKKGESFEYESNGGKVRLELKTDVPFGHKVAIRQIGENELVMKYGRAIGAATEPIEAGAHVHVHNCAGLRGRGDVKGGTVS